jgi:hypothetical protein
VRWIEMAAIMPFWTTMIVYYVEGDEGHVMNEPAGAAKWRSKVRGACFSFVMPWKDIIKEFTFRHQQDPGLRELPRDGDILQYMFRLHLRVAGKDFSKQLTQVRLRPFVLKALLEFLVQRRHPEFLGHATVEEWRQAVNRKYPETEGHLPLDQRQGVIPSSIEQMLEEQTTEQPADQGKRRRLLVTKKHASPGAPDESSAQSALDFVEPRFCILDSADASKQRQEAFEKFVVPEEDVLQIQTGDVFEDQWQTKFWRSAMPFVFTGSTSGPDAKYDNPKQRERKTHTDLDHIGRAPQKRSQDVRA